MTLVSMITIGVKFCKIRKKKNVFITRTTMMKLRRTFVAIWVEGRQNYIIMFPIEP